MKLGKIQAMYRDPNLGIPNQITQNSWIPGRSPTPKPVITNKVPKNVKKK